MCLRFVVLHKNMPAEELAACWAAFSDKNREKNKIINEQNNQVVLLQRSVTLTEAGCTAHGISWV